MSINNKIVATLLHGLFLCIVTGAALAEKLMCPKPPFQEVICPIEGVEYHGLPNHENWRSLGSYYDDRIDEISGKETVIVGYQKGAIQFLIAYLNGKPYGYWYFNTLTNVTFGNRSDCNGNGNFEQVIGGSGQGTIDTEFYGCADINLK